MVVVEGGRDHVGENVNIAVTSVLQTSAGRMIFGRFEGAHTVTNGGGREAVGKEPGGRETGGRR